jgi:hypothetical protein
VEISNDASKQITQKIARDFGEHVGRYDQQKYPPTELIRLQRAFSDPDSAAETDILAALIWKYGHTGKKNFPRKHRELAVTVAELWRDHAIRRDEQPEVAFERWRALLGRTRFITTIFLLHLTWPDAIPILDQHNFRSVNHHLNEAGIPTSGRKKPSRFDDVILVRQFIQTVLREWREVTGTPPPTIRDMDRYLMMHGKQLKSRR